MKVYVSGATGFVGSHVARELREQGAEVRDERVDLLDSDALERVIEGCDAVVHVAALYSYDAPELEFERVNVEGTRTILAAALAKGVRRFLHTSTAGTCGPVPGAIATEEDEPPEWELTVPYKRTKLESERLALAAGAVVVNPTTPVGEGDAKPTPTGQMIVDFLNRRMPAYVDTGLNLIDVRDVARGHLLAAKKGRVGERYILGNRDLTLQEILETLSRLSGLPAPKVRLPHAIPLVFGAVSSAAARITGRPPRVSLDSVRMSMHRMFFDAGKAVRELGLPQTPIEEPLARAVEWFRAKGYVRG